MDQAPVAEVERSDPQHAPNDDQPSSPLPSSQEHENSRLSRQHDAEDLVAHHDSLPSYQPDMLKDLETQSRIEPPSSEADIQPLSSDVGQDSFIAKSTHNDSTMSHNASDFDDSTANEDSAIQERMMRRKLMDIESSFLPDQAHLSAAEPLVGVRPGADDTYLFGGSPGNGLKAVEQSSAAHTRTDSAQMEEVDDAEDLSMATPSDAYKTPAPRRESLHGDDAEGETSLIGDGASSPSAEAARRSHARVRSADQYGQNASSEEARTDQSTEQVTPQNNIAMEVLPITTIKPLEAHTAQHSMEDAESLHPRLPEDGLLSPKSEASSIQTFREGMKPRTTHSRQLSQYSTISAFSEQSSAPTANGSGRDGVGDPVGSRGAATASNGTLGRSLSNSLSLSRLPSTSSMVSSVSDFPESMNERQRVSSRPGNLQPLDERGEPATPRPNPLWHTLSSNNPTDTLITQHVRNIHVPETVAREFIRNHAPPASQSPEKRTSSLAFSRTGGKSTLTLKEQDSKIDRLSKENFDLKLKIHFLDQALQNRSDEGVKEMIDKNVQLQTDLANEKKETQGLRRKIRELEKKIKGLEDGQDANQKKENTDTEEGANADERYLELEEEVTYLRECLQRSETQVERFRQETMSREVERRKLADHIKSLSDNQSRRVTEDEPPTGVEEAMEMWKDLLEAETARREQADEDAQRARDEARSAKQQAAALQAQIASMRPTSSGGIGAGSTTTNHIRNTYHINKRQHYSYNGVAQSGENSAKSGEGTSTPGVLVQDHDPLAENVGGAVRPGTSAGESISMTTTSTLVDQLKHENAELRRDLGAQTSMLTSRNRERERLQQEIEDLKLHARRVGSGGSGVDRLGSIAGDSIFERSVSRAGQRRNHVESVSGLGGPTGGLVHGPGASRVSGGTEASRGGIGQDDDVVLVAQVEKEREEWERQLNVLKDQVNSAKMLSQDLERECNSALDELERREKEILALQDERTGLVEDLQSLQAERDEALLTLEEREEELKALREEAEGLIADLEDKGVAGEEEAGRIMADLDARNEDFSTLQGEMRTVSEKLVGLEDDMAGKRRRIGVLEGEAKDFEREIEELDRRVAELSGKNERLEVQLESTQSEISFLREEQEGDKIKIGELEASLAGAQQAYQEERERVEEERKQREILSTEEKGEVQKLMDELNAQLSKARDEVRRLRKSLSSKEVEATTWKDRLNTLEGGLRDALGDINGTRSTFLKNIQELQSSLDTTSADLDAARAALAEKKAELHQHNGLLESTSLESRRLGDMLEKERTAHRQARAQIDQVSRQHLMVSRTLQAHEVKTQELETQRSTDRRKIGQLEDRFREQLLERNGLLLTLWHRLSAICGPDWVQRYKLVDGHVPSVAVLEKNLPGFNKLVVSAIKEIESIVGGFRSRVRVIEKDLWKDYQMLEHSLDQHLKRLESVERTVAEQHVEMLAPAPPERKSSILRSLSQSASRGGDAADNARLRNENKMLRAELQMHRTAGRPTSIAESALSDGHRPVSRAISTMTAGTPSSLHRGFTAGSTEQLEQQQQQHNSYDRDASGGDPFGPDAAAAAASAADSPTISRTNSAKRTASLSRQGRTSNTNGTSNNAGSNGNGVTAPLQPSEARWIHRLKELERRLKAEREARLLDRSGARKRLEQGQRENEELRGRLEREKVARNAAVGAGEND